MHDGSYICRARPLAELIHPNINAGTAFVEARDIRINRTLWKILWQDHIIGHILTYRFDASARCNLLWCESLAFQEANYSRSLEGPHSKRDTNQIHLQKMIKNNSKFMEVWHQIVASLE